MATDVGGHIVDAGVVALPEVFPPKLLPWLVESHLYFDLFHTNINKLLFYFLPLP